jgi:hypothetical protein
MREIPHQILDDSARVYPEKIAIEEPGRGKISYGELASLSEQKSPRVLQHIAPKIENHLLLEPGGDKTVHNRQRVLDAHDHQASHDGKNESGQFPRSKKDAPRGPAKDPVDGLGCSKASRCRNRSNTCRFICRTLRRYEKHSRL